MEQDFSKFLNECPIPYFFTRYASSLLRKKGFIELFEKDKWEEIPTKGYIIRDGRSLIAFNKGGLESGMFFGSCSDSPSLKIKTNPECVQDSLKVIRTVPYGNIHCFSWTNKDLKVVGKIQVNEQGKITWKLVDSKKGIAIIPFCSKNTVDYENDFNPIVGTDSNQFYEYVASLANVEVNDVLSWDLSFVPIETASSIGANNEFFVGNFLNCMSGVYASLKSFVQSDPGNTTNFLVVYDSSSKMGFESMTGARSNFLPSVLSRVIGGPEIVGPFIEKSLFVNLQSFNAVHPNFVDRYDESNSALIGKGIMIESNPSIDMKCQYLIKHACQKRGLNLQVSMSKKELDANYNTIGAAVSKQIGIPFINVGIPLLNKFSTRETISLQDVEDLITLCTELYSHYPDHQIDFE